MVGYLVGFTSNGFIGCDWFSFGYLALPFGCCRKNQHSELEQNMGRPDVFAFVNVNHRKMAIPMFALFRSYLDFFSLIFLGGIH